MLRTRLRLMAVLIKLKALALQARASSYYFLNSLNTPFLYKHQVNLAQAQLCLRFRKTEPQYMLEIIEITVLLFILAKCVIFLHADQGYLVSQYSLLASFTGFSLLLQQRLQHNLATLITFKLICVIQIFQAQDMLKKRLIFGIFSALVYLKALCLYKKDVSFLSFQILVAC